MVVLSSDEAITDLIEKRSSIYADRVSDEVILTFRSDTGFRGVAAPHNYDEVVRPKLHFRKLPPRPLIFIDRTGATEWAFAMMPYGTPWRVRRKLCHEVLNGKLAESFDDHHYKYVHRLLSCLLEEPKNFIQELNL